MARLKKFKITFVDIEDRAETEEEAYDLFLSYLADVVKNQDLTAFNFEEVKG